MEIKGLELVVSKQEIRLLRRALEYMKDQANFEARPGAIMYVTGSLTQDEREILSQMLNVFWVTQ